MSAQALRSEIVSALLRGPHDMRADIAEQIDPDYPAHYGSATECIAATIRWASEDELRALLDTVQECAE